jgi:hypothetical protein
MGAEREKAAKDGPMRTLFQELGMEQPAVPSEIWTKRKRS